MKKILTFILTAAMLLSVSACNSQESGNMKGKHVLKDLADARATATTEPTETEPTETETEPVVTDTVDPTTSAAIPPAGSEYIKVGIINNDPNESAYRAANDRDLKDVFKQENGYDASFFYSLKNDEQISAARLFIQQQVDYLLIRAADSNGWEPVLQDAKDAGIHVILFDRPIDVDPDLYDTVVMSDMEFSAKVAVYLLEAEGLPEYNILHLQGILGSEAQKARTGALEAMVAKDTDWCIVGQRCCEWTEQRAEEYVSAVIASGDKFNVIYAENDAMAKGAVNALDNAGITHGVGKEVIILSYDCAYWAMEEVLRGNWNYEMQSSPFQAAYIDKVIQDMEAGTPPPKQVTVEDKGFAAITITPEDVEKYGLK